MAQARNGGGVACSKSDARRRVENVSKQIKGMGEAALMRWRNNRSGHRHALPYFSELWLNACIDWRARRSRFAGENGETPRP